jgi:hypothetical protein
MKPAWKRIQIIRDLHAVPEYLVITVWGRQFRVELAPALRQHLAHLSAEVTVEIVGPTVGSYATEPPALRVFRVDDADRQDCLVPVPVPTARPTLQLVAHDATSLPTDEEVTLVQGKAPPVPEKGGRHG